MGRRDQQDLIAGKTDDVFDDRPRNDIKDHLCNEDDPPFDRGPGPGHGPCAEIRKKGADDHGSEAQYGAARKIDEAGAQQDLPLVLGSYGIIQRQRHQNDQQRKSRKDPHIMFPPEEPVIRRSGLTVKTTGGMSNLMNDTKYRRML